VHRLRDRLARLHRDPDARVIETHISFVILAGAHAWKIKKAVDLGFLDFSTLARRHRFCREELRLNRRLAPTLYLDVVAVCGTPQDPHLGEPGPVLEYAVYMARFPDDEQLDRVLSRGALDPDACRQIARQVAAFHAGAPRARAATPYGALTAVRAPMMENFEQLAACVPTALSRATLNALRTWTRAELDRRRGALRSRKRAGHVRECHGDLHLANMAWHHDELVVFDCIEFSPDLRWIDTASDLAFLLMDLDHRAQPTLAAHVLNTYLAHTGDYDALAVIDLYRVYRALVRAKVACIRARQSPGTPDAAAVAEVRELVALARGYTRRPPPVLVITCGVSGSGKSWLARQVAAQVPAIWLRSDVERKRLAGLDPHSRTDSAPGQGLYSARMTQRTYARLRALSRTALASGHSVVVDATFLTAAERAGFLELAQRARIPVRILATEAPETVLRERVRERAARGQDPSEADEAVLDRQLAARQPFTRAERTRVIAIDTHAPLDTGALVRRLRAARRR